MLGAGGKPAAGVAVGEQRRQAIVKALSQATMAVTGALRVFCRLPLESVGRSFSLPSGVRTKTIRAGEQLAEVGPIFISA